MTIRRQFILVVTLLFAGVGAVGGLVAWRLQTQAIRQAFETEGQALAVSVGEFLDATQMKALRGTADWTQTPFGAAWDRWQRWHMITRVYVVDPASGAAVMDTARSFARPDPEVWRDLGRNDSRLLPFRELPSGNFRLPVLVRSADGTAVVGVEIAADPYFRLRREIVQRGEAQLAWAVGLGLCVGAILGGFLARSVRRLTDAVESVGSPAFESVDVGSPVREVAELGAALGVMHSVLGDTLDKARRTLIESDQFRTEAGLAELWRRTLQPADARRERGADAAWLSVGTPPPPAFAGTAKLATQSGAAFAGIAAEHGGMEASVRARAAGTYLADLLSRRSLDEAAAETFGLFGLSRLVVARWSGDACEIWVDGSTLGPDQISWKSGSPLLLSGLGPRNLERVRLYLAAFGRHPIREMISELPPLLDASEPGIVLILRRSQDNQPVAP
ncbi:MAG TPA: hypothetical protein VGL42_01570 [Opitutaceae bacterium]|jgi:hypothetical protein